MQSDLCKHLGKDSSTDHPDRYSICLKDYRIRSFLSIQYVQSDLCKHLGKDSSTDHPNLFLNAYINRNVHADYLKMI